MTEMRGHLAFIGTTVGGNTIILRLIPYEEKRYKPNPGPVVRFDFLEDRYFLYLNDDEPVELTNPRFELYDDVDLSIVHIVITSLEWCGRAVGTRKEWIDRVELEKRYGR